MKLESTLPEQPGLLFAVPVVNLFGLLLALLLLGPVFVTQSGVAIELAPSRLQLDRFAEPLVITVGPGDEPLLFVGHERVGLERLGRRLDAEVEQRGGAGERVAVLRIDRSVPVTIERQVAELALERGFRVMLAGRASHGGVDAAPARRVDDGGR
jgi:hypothetical protein